MGSWHCPSLSTQTHHKYSKLRVRYVSNVKASAPEAKLGAASPLLIVLLTDNGPKNSIFPDVLASQIVQPVTTPQVAVGAGNVMVPLFDVTALAPAPDDATVDPAAWVPAQPVEVIDAVIGTRA